MHNSLNLPAPVFDAAIIVLGVLALYFALKIAHFILKIILVLIGLALLGGAVWLWLAR